MNFVKFFYTESKLTDLRLHTYFIWVGTHFEALNLGGGYRLGAPPRRRDVFATPNFTI